MQVFDDFTIDSKEQWIQINDTLSELSSGTSTLNQTVNLEQNRFYTDLIKVTVDPSGFNEEEDMGLSWNMTVFTADYFELQLKFNQP